MADRLTFEQIHERFAAVGFVSALFRIDDKPDLVAGLTLSMLPEYGKYPALDAVTDGLEARAETYELVFTGYESGKATPTA